MQQLLGEKTGVDNSVLRELFLQRLPANTQMILASADGMTIDELAEMADKIMDVATLTVPAINTAAKDDRMCKIFNKEFDKRHRSPPRNFSNSKSRGRNRSRRRSTSHGHSLNRQAKRDGVYRYEARFGENARNSRPPCSAGNGGASR